MVLITRHVAIIIKTKHLTAGAVVWGYSVKKVFLEISQKSQENSCAESLF